MSSTAGAAGDPSTGGPKRGRGLSRERIARVTLELIDEQGVGAASMRQIAARLGVEAMSLYKHVDTRDALLDAVAELIVAELDADPEVPRAPEDGWRDYLIRLAGGVRRYALAHPHAFPLVTTRPAGAPWINPPLRSLAWIEAFFEALFGEGFTEEQALFTYRSFNSFLLGYLLMETGAKTLADPQDGDGSFAAGADAAEPVPGGLSPTRSPEETDAIADSGPVGGLLDPQADIDADEFPAIHQVANRLAEEHFSEEFDLALRDLLERVAAQLGRAS